MLDPTKSSSLQLGTQNIPLNYGSGSASGVLARDTVTMGPFTVNPQSFGVLLSLTLLPFLSHPPPLPRVSRVVYSLLARVTNAKVCFVRWQ